MPRRVPKPNFRPGERPCAFTRLALEYRRRYQPEGAEAEALVNTLTYLQWRIGRYRLEECVLRFRYRDHPDQPHALGRVLEIIRDLEQISSSTTSALLYLRTLANAEASDDIDYTALNRNLASFRQELAATPITHLQVPPPPRTKPN